MTAQIVTASGGLVPLADMQRWCDMWADGDRRLRAAEIAQNVFGCREPQEPGQLWERLREATEPPRCTPATPHCIGSERGNPCNCGETPWSW